MSSSAKLIMSIDKRSVSPARPENRQKFREFRTLIDARSSGQKEIGGVSRQAVCDNTNSSGSPLPY